MIVVGALALAGGIVWLVLDKKPTEKGDKGPERLKMYFVSILECSVCSCPSSFKTRPFI